jgi:murein DD-endopeptidase MepM/ murein hydrolase activator NlpD
MRVSNFWRYLLSLFKQKEPDYVTQMPKLLKWPVRPNRGVRQNDALGSGSFGASRDGGARQHLGIDLIAHPGDDVVAMCPLEVTRIGLAYANSSLRSVHLKGWDEWGAYTFKLLYVEPEVTVGEILRAGEVIGVAQDLRDRYPDITRHVHFEVHNLQGAVNPLPLLEG